MEARPNDLRVVKTIDAIHAAFKAMLMEMDFADVTVKELCARARINKKTFYRYYPAIEYLLREVQKEYEGPYLRLVDGLSFPDDTEAITRAFLRYSADQDGFYERLTCAGPHESIRDEMIAEVEESHEATRTAPDGWDEGVWDLYLGFVTTTPLAIYQRWIEGGKMIPAAEMVETGCKLVCAGADALVASAGR